MPCKNPICIIIRAPFVRCCSDAVFAAEKSASEPTAVTKEEPLGEILYEITEERNAYTKVYQRDDGTRTAMVCETPIHYSEGGAWKEIDNTPINRNGKNKS